METDPLVSTVIIILIAIFDFFVALAKSAFEHASEKIKYGDQYYNNSTHQRVSFHIIPFIYII